METLSKVDFAFRNLRPEDRFRVIRRRPRESHVDFLQRVEREYDAVYPDEEDMEKRFYEIKRRFIEGGNFPIWQQDRLSPYATMRELLFGAETLTTRDTQRQRPRQSPPRITNAPSGNATRVPAQYPSANQTTGASTTTDAFIANPFVAQAQFQSPNSGASGGRNQGFVAVATSSAGAAPPVLPTYSLRDGTTSFRPPPRDRVSAPISAKRAPVDAELGELRFSFCGNCRMFSHPTSVCHYKSFCARCNVEGQHEDKKCPLRNGNQPPAMQMA